MFVQIDSSVHIRHESTKRDIQLTFKSWENLLGTKDQLSEDMVNILASRQWVTKEYPLGEDMYISINSPWKWIHIYPWYEGMNRLNRKVISLTFPQWKQLVKLKVE